MSPYNKTRKTRIKFPLLTDIGVIEKRLIMTILAGQVSCLKSFETGNGTPVFEDNHVGFFRRETETLAIQPGSDDVEDFLEKSMGSDRIGGA